MKDTRWQRAKEIFDGARGLAPDLRASFINTACSGDNELQAEVEILLTSYKSDFLEDTALGAADILIESDLIPGQVIGRYRIGELIGTGGMGQVFRAEDTELDRPVAFKVLHGDIAENDERVRRFIQEAKAASALNHPNILTIYEIGSFEGSRFIVSEYIDGDTLRERMRAGLTVSDSLDITCQIAAALKAAHSAGIVHRDIKPENVMLRPDGLVKVLDFGLAKLTEADDLPIDANAPPLSRLQTSPGLIMGTVAYMSPEQARGQAVDSRTDLWSLGVVFHEMLTGESPFKGESVTDLVTSILKHDPASLDLKSISQELKPICSKALAKDKNARYQTAQDLLQDLQGEKKRMEYAIQPTPFITVSSSDELKTQLIRRPPTLSAEYIVTGIKRHKLATFTALTLVTFLAVGLSVYKYNGAPQYNSGAALQPVVDPSTTEDELKFSKLVTSGKVLDIAISPDGRYIAYVTGEQLDSGERVKNSIRLRQIDTSSDVEIVPSISPGKLMDLSFAPDGSHLYYGYKLPGNAAIYKVPLLGGTPTKMADNAGCGSLSPDGKIFAFHRGTSEGKDVLILTNADGTNERSLLNTQRQWTYGGYCGGAPAWSPDGKTIASWNLYTDKDGGYVKISGINIADGSEQQMSDKEFKGIKGAVYMPNGSLVITAIERSADDVAASQLWLIAPGSPAKRLTNDLTGFSGVGTTAKGDMLVTWQFRETVDLWTAPDNDVSRARQVTSSGEAIYGGPSWTPDGKLVVSSFAGHTVDIWKMNADGTDRKQLTTDRGWNSNPRVSPDGRYIVFVSARDSGLNVFRMDVDGRNEKRLTNDIGGHFPQISPDGKWVYYFQPRNSPAVPFGNDGYNICKISINGGEPVVLSSAPILSDARNFAVSPVDGRIAYEQTQSIEGRSTRKLFIISPNGGPPIKTIQMPPTFPKKGAFSWTPDGRGIAFTDTRNGGANIWKIGLDGKTDAQPLINFATYETVGFDWSSDGKQLAVSRAVVTGEAFLISRISK